MLKLLGQATNSFVDTSYIDNTIEKLLSKNCDCENLCKNSYFQGSYLVISKFIELYKKVENLGFVSKQAIADLKKTLNSEVLHNYFIKVYNKMGFDSRFILNNLSLETVWDFYKDEKNNYFNDCADYESFMKGVQTPVALLKYGFNHERTKQYKGLITSFAKSTIKDIVGEIRKKQVL